MILDTALLTGDIRLLPTTITSKVSSNLVIVCILFYKNDLHHYLETNEMLSLPPLIVTPLLILLAGCKLRFSQRPFSSGSENIFLCH